MLRTLKKNDCVETGLLGGFCPYRANAGGRILVADTAREMFSALPPDKRRIEPTAFFKLLE